MDNLLGANIRFRLSINKEKIDLEKEEYMHYVAVFNKYKFLLSQLVGRDFKTKYKRSFLGVLWSLLNPLLIMLVQYMVFSELFRFDIANFPVYLLSGTVMFNFFSESTSQALLSITGNATLITKVRVPLQIFPISKVISSGINFAFAFIVLLIIVLIQGLSFNIYYFFLPFVLLCVFLFSMGVSFILSTMMVYFRDIEFLYGVVLSAWSYLTPLFYPETILPTKYMVIMECNPMYHFIRYFRIIVLNGKLPSVQAHVFCAIFAIGMFLIGSFLFNKSKRNFILNI